MLLRFAVAVTALEFALTIAASILVTYTEPPTGFLTEQELRELGISFVEHENRRWVHLNAPCYDTRATLSSPSASLYVSLRTDSSQADYDFRRRREEAIRERRDRGEVVLINEPLPGELGYAVRFRGDNAVRFEMARLHGRDMLIVRVIEEKPFDTTESAALSKCEHRARAVQEHLMFKMRWRD
jgi:hypothetical protein